jgi:hypothetical protein
MEGGRCPGVETPVFTPPSLWDFAPPRSRGVISLPASSLLRGVGRGLLFLDSAVLSDKRSYCGRVPWRR